MTSTEDAVRRVRRYLDAIGTPNDPIVWSYYRDADGNRIGPAVNLLAADLRALLALAEGLDEIATLPTTEKR